MIVALIILIGLSAFFSAAETAYNSLNEIRLRSKAEDGDAKAAHTLALVERYDSLLSTILIGNNIVNIGSASIATTLFTIWLGADKGAAISTVVMTIVVLIFGEVLPKNYAKANADSLAMTVAGPISVLMVIFKPLSAVLNFLSGIMTKLTGHTCYKQFHKNSPP